ncbi:hypothetical protein [Labrenzia sp. DG1229]|uniref:DUF4376 domain-containing protein n=1 Tax=Labrenzia sp. DG1229 TaxID=681847 RepID=UPI000B193098|nr:hypothetical protein [Labrenzia sp. DG1229]
MLTGFYHPARFGGVPWFPRTEPSAVYLAGLPAGTVTDVPLKPGDDYDYDPGSNAWVHNPPPVSDDQVNTERQRRIDLGAEFTLTGSMVIAITGRQQDQTVLLGSSIAAQSLAAGGETNPVMVYRDRDNQIRNLTPLEMIELYTKGLTWITAIMQVSWAMKDGTGAYTSGIPSDYTDDSHWPTPTDIGL